MANLIYLDYCATTPVDERVLDAMLPYFRQYYGNASSISHSVGRQAAAAVENARKQVAGLLNCSEKELIFTSGATEAINMALKGIFDRYKTIGKHYITCCTEHPAVLEVFSYLEKQGAEVSYLGVDANGCLDLAELAAEIREDTIAIVIMHANNETGVIHPIKEIAEIAAQHHVLFFCDATQSAGKINLDLQQISIDVLCLSAHKLYGPKGVGALYIRRKRRPTQISKWLHGGAQENQRRGGTINVPGIVGFGAAAVMALAIKDQEYLRLKNLRDYMESELLKIDETAGNGYRVDRLPHVANIRFNYLKGETIMSKVPELAISSGSACSAGLRSPSHVLLAMGLNSEEVHASIRISLGKYTTKQDVNKAIVLLKTEVNKLRALSPIWQLHQVGLHK